ncbi:sortase B protein-sorting domain-containing protein [Peptacetobacter hiranonis]|nr:sortase B protein-sorting domain-containing protein [Peptacetobacter hiranonis]RHQ98814.1 sortase B protein-sorting domain-containing protein [Peptoclostridium sp. AF21-18]
MIIYATLFNISFLFFIKKSLFFY